MPKSRLSITFQRLDSEEDIQTWGLDSFAASFNHRVTRIFPIWIALGDGNLLGYCHLHPHMVAYPAITPEITPVQFYQLAWEWFSLIKRAYGDPWVLADPISMPKATPGLLSKVAMQPVHNLYRVRD